MLGLITVNESSTLEDQFRRCLPEQVNMSSVHVPFHEVSYQGLVQMISHIPAAARTLAEDQPDVIAVACFTASCIRGNEIVNMVQQTVGIPAIVPSLEFVRILRLLGAKRIALVTCFASELRVMEQLFFHKNQINVVKFIETDSLQSDPVYVNEPEYDHILDRLRQIDLSDVEALVIDLPAFDIDPNFQEKLDRFINIPVLTQLRVLLWSALEQVSAPRDGCYLSRFLP